MGNVQLIRFIFFHFKELYGVLPQRGLGELSVEAERTMNFVLQESEAWQNLFSQMGMEMGGAFPTIVDMGAPSHFLPITRFHMASLEADLFLHILKDCETHRMELEAESEQKERDEVEHTLYVEY